MEKACWEFDPEDGCHKERVIPSGAVTCYMPWNREGLVGWDIVGMNHYHVNGARYLFCAMTRGGRCITAEGGYENEVFDELERKAEGI